MIERSDVHKRRALVFSIGDYLCALPLHDVVETMRPLPIEAIEAAPPFVLGVSIIRGKPVVVVDAMALLGTAPVNHGRFVLIRVDERQIALAVRAVIDVREIEPDLLDQLPPLLAEATPAAVEALGRLDLELLVVLRGANLVPTDVWDAMPAARVS